MEAEEKAKEAKSEEKPEEKPEDEVIEQASGPVAGGPRAGKSGPPIALDSAICIVFVLLFALLCRRFV
jgi:hypothetical protein